MGDATKELRTAQLLEGISRAARIIKDEEKFSAITTTNNLLTLMLDPEFRNNLEPVDDSGYRWMFQGIEIAGSASRHDMDYDVVEFHFYILGKSGLGHFSVDIDSLRITTTRMFKSQGEAEGMLRELKGRVE